MVARPLLLQRTRTIARVASLLGLDAARLQARIDAETERALAIDNVVKRQEALRRPLVVASPVAFDTVAWAEEQARDFPGLVVDVALRRTYPCGAAAGPLLGYTGPLSAAEVARLRAARKLLDWTFFRDADAESFLAAREGARFPDEPTGRGGVEESYDAVLAGAAGARVLERDPATRRWRTIAEIPPAPGRDVTLTIDLDLQRAAEDALDEAVRAANGGEHGGALVLLDPERGEVLALATAPRFDPNTVRRDYAAIAAAGGPTPLLDRPIAVALPPGSTMKPLVASASLEERIALGGEPIGPETEIFCRGYLRSPKDRYFRCDARSGHGPIALTGALAQSCNIYFFLAGEQLGEPRLTAWGRRFGLGLPTGIDLPGEADGLFPSAEWKARRGAAARERVARGEKNALLARLALAGTALLPAPGGPLALPWAAAEVDDRDDRLAKARRYAEAIGTSAWTVGDSRNTAIGQGNVLATPLQIASLAATLAAGGRRARPHVALRIGDADAPVPPAPPPVSLSPATLAAVKAGMRAVVDSPFGTARGSGLSRFRAAGKTGTAQAGPHGDHAWFMGFAPVEAPDVAFCCLVEHVNQGLAGGNVAAPVVARVLAAREAQGHERGGP
jgi:penicillin-binding protein 2